MHHGIAMVQAIPAPSLEKTAKTDEGKHGINEYNPAIETVAMPFSVSAH
jgi:hypothetical protein